MPQIQANGINLYYELYGDGPPLVLIEGIGYATWMWFRQVGPLSAANRLLIYDNRGVGNSEKPEVDYTLQDMADDLLGLLDALGIQKATVLGLSMGGTIAQQFTLSYPERVERLILASTHLGLKAMIPIPEEAARLMVPDTSLPPAARIRKAMAPAFAPGWAEAHPGIVDAIVFMRLAAVQPPDAWLRQWNAGATFDSVDRIASISVPTLIMHGDQDRVVPVGNAHMIAGRLPEAELRIFQGGGHLVHIEQSELYNRTVLDFLR